jgi:hypothetical protein
MRDLHSHPVAPVTAPPSVVPYTYRGIVEDTSTAPITIKRIYHLTPTTTVFASGFIEIGMDINFQKTGTSALYTA